MILSYVPRGGVDVILVMWLEPFESTFLRYRIRRSLHMKFEFNLPSDFVGDYV